MLELWRKQWSVMLSKLAFVVLKFTVELLVSLKETLTENPELMDVVAWTGCEAVLSVCTFGRHVIIFFKL